MPDAHYHALDTSRLRDYLNGLPIARERLGGTAQAWTIREVGDGNLNLVFIIEGSAGGLVVKQALPYVRLVGESWPLPLKRSFFESSALAIQAQHAPALTPQVFHYDNDMALIVMEYLTPHITLRKGLIRRRIYPRAAQDIAIFMARTLFHTSMLASSAEAHKARIELFASNTALCRITEDLVFTDPYRVAELNRWTRPYLDGIKADFEADAALKIAVQEKKWQFITEAQAVIHGDLHTGSVMVTETETRVIDPEFAFVGPMAFDVGAIIANYLLSFFAHAGQGQGQPDPYCDWLLDQTKIVWSAFKAEFLHTWEHHADGETFGQGLFKDDAALAALARYRADFMDKLFRDSLGFAGCKMIRRILGLAHVEDMESIADARVRAGCELLALGFARNLVLNAASFNGIEDVVAAARHHVNATQHSQGALPNA